jgi:putative membrane protein
MVTRLVLASLAVILPASIAFAQEAAAQPMEKLSYGIVSTLVFGLIGIGLALLGMKMFEWVMPFSVRKEIEQDHNTAVAILMAAVVLGVSMIIAATLLS